MSTYYKRIVFKCKCVLVMSIDGYEKIHINIKYNIELTDSKNSNDVWKVFSYTNWNT